MSRPAIIADHVSKEYRIRHNLAGPQGSFKAVLNAPFNWLLRRTDKHQAFERSERFFALRDVSFEIQHGESVGLIGRNGAGKSTLLKMLSRITRPSAGRITIFEHVNALL